MSLSRITDPTTSCVKVAEAKEFLRIRGTTAEDYLFRSFIKVAEEYAENYMKRSIMPQQWRLKLDAIPYGDEIELPRGPLSTVATAVSNFSYYDSTNATNAMPTTAYTVDADAVNPRIYLTYDSQWPSDIRNHRDSINIEYWTGYANADAVPEEIKTWVKLRVGAYYENRESMMVGSGNFITELPHSYIDGLLDIHTVIKVT